MWKVISVGQSVAVTLATTAPLRRKQSAMDVVSEDPPAATTTGATTGETSLEAPLDSKQEADGAMPAVGAVKQVQMQVPEASGKEEDIDEKTGLSKYSLQFILSSFYAKAMGKKQQTSSSVVAAAADTDAAVGEASSATTAVGDAAAEAADPSEKDTSRKGSADKEEETFNMIAEEPTVDEISIQLGIVIISSGDTYDTAAKQQHTLPAYICAFHDFLDSPTSTSGTSNLLGDWRKASSEVGRTTYMAEVSVGNKFFTGAPATKYTYVNSLVGSTIYSTCGSGDNAEGSGTASEHVVACHMRLQEDGKLEVRLLKDLTSTAAASASSAAEASSAGGPQAVHSVSGNSNSNGEESSYESRVCGAGVVGELLYKCRFLTTPQAMSDHDDDVE